MANNNPYLASLKTDVAERFGTDSLSMTYADWISKNTSMKGMPFNFKRYPFQVQIANDMHPNLDCIKCSQIGLSEIQIRKSLAFLMRNRGTSVIFTLPTLEMRKRTSQTRVAPIVDGDKVFNTKQNEGDTRSMGLMQFGSSFLYITNCDEGAATSIAADAVFNDEVDLSDQTNLSLFNSRLQGSDWKISQRFSTPSYNGFGIDLSYQASDQHEYMLRCTGCNHWQVPTFTRQFCDIPGLPTTIDALTEMDATTIELLDLENAKVVCEKCRRPVDLSDASIRAWVPKHPARTHSRGYYVRPFCTDRLPISYILTQLMKYKRTDKLRGFYNTVLGEPFDGGNNRLTRTQIDQCFSTSSLTPKEEWVRTRPAWIGIDIGLTCHMVVLVGDTQKETHAVEFCSFSVEDIEGQVNRILKTYNVVSGSVDRHPYTPTANDIRELSKGLIWPTEYRGKAEINIKQEDGIVQINRTDIIDEAFRRIRNKEITFSGYGYQREIIVEHMRDLVREEEPHTPATYKKLTGNDHYAHALAYAFAGMLIKETLSESTHTEIRSCVLTSVVNMGAHDGNSVLTPNKHRKDYRDTIDLSNAQSWTGFNLLD